MNRRRGLPHRAWLRLALLGVMLLAACSPSPTASGSPTPRPSRTATPTPTPSPTPTPRPSPPALAAAGGIQVPAGFQAYVYASGLSEITAMAYGPDGRLYATAATGALWVVPAPGQGAQLIRSGMPTALGLVWRGADLFVSVRGSIRAFHLSGGALQGGETVVAGLPVGRHQNDNLLLLPNGDFLVGAGSTCDVCNEADARSATVLRYHGDWSYAGIVVRGARNPYGLAFRSSEQRAYVTVNGQDNLGAQPADELLPVVDGENAGWPRCWPSYPDGALHGSCAGVSPPTAVFTPHSSADGIVFYGSTEFPAAYRDNAFVTEWGANVGGPVGRRVERVVMSSAPAQVSDFATGFSHPLAVAVGEDGGLLVGDYGTGQIIEIFNLG
ncbi:MAG TPA: PQQ-dependent sugar dehydrogenase [Candidatus Limnocylindrales bacterium]|nr:PQQ-dependent sugar dehydrogenase [Candidatus Limnocylindrales bacterium]